MNKMISILFLAGVAAFLGAGDAAMAVNPEVTVPPIDRLQPENVEVATFALG